MRTGCPRCIPNTPVSMRDSRALRDAVIATAIEMNALGINRGKAGNVSARIDTGFLVTPSGVPYGEHRMSGPPATAIM